MSSEMWFSYIENVDCFTSQFTKRNDISDISNSSNNWIFSAYVIKFKHYKIVIK